MNPIKKVKLKISNLTNKAKIFYFGIIPLSLLSMFIYITYIMFLRIKKVHPGYFDSLYLGISLRSALNLMLVIILIVVIIALLSYLIYKSLNKIYRLIK